MGIGAGIFLLALGGVLAFAVSDRIDGVDLTMVGYILMGAGALGIVLALFLSGRRTRGDRASRTTVVEDDDPTHRDPRI